MAKFYILPTTDIHLVKDSSYTSAQQFRLKFLFEGSDFDKDLLLFSDYSAGVISVEGDYADTNNPWIVITALNVGLTFIRIKYLNQECFVRVWVHQAINRIWINNNHLSIYSGNDFHGYVPSVFAVFSDNEIGDITYHPYLTYEETGTTSNNELTFNNHIIRHPNVVTTEYLSKIKIGIGGKEDESDLLDEVDVTIKKTFQSDREILEKLFIGDDKDAEHINLLIVAEGFKDKSDFMLFANNLKDNLIDNNVHSPWNFITKRLTVWIAYEPYADVKQGTTVNYPISEKNIYLPNFEGGNVKRQNSNNFTLKELIYEVGLPNNNSPASYSVITSYWPVEITSKVEQGIFNAWKDYNKVKGYIENKDTMLGISSGYRLGDKIESKPITSPETKVNDWYNREGDNDVMNFDRRRYPYDIYGEVVSPLKSGVKLDEEGKFVFGSSGPGAVDKYLGSLTYANAPAGPNMGSTWQTIGKDSTLIAIVCNNYKWGGTYYSKGLANAPHYPILRLAVSMLNIANVNQHRITSDNNLPAKLSDNIVAKDIHKNDFDPIRIAGIMAHELMHSSAHLGDEYEIYDGDPRNPEQINEHTNLMTIEKVKKDNSVNDDKRIDSKKIKWNLRRVALSSLIIKPVLRNGSLLTVTVESDQISKWQRVLNNKDSNGTLVKLPLYLRSSLYNRLEEFLFYEIAIEYIHEINSNNNTLVLKVEDSELPNLNLDMFEYGCHIYLPKRLKNDYDYDPLPQSQNEELYIINPRVLEYINKTEKALSEKTVADCTTTMKGPQFPDESDTKINEETISSFYPDFCSPQNRFLVSGIYEGGISSCFTYRPSGNSLMRKMIFWESEVDTINIDTGEVLYTDSFNAPFLGKDMIAIYSRFDFFAKYCFLAIYYPTKLEDLDRAEYHYYDRTNFKSIDND